MKIEPMESSKKEKRKRQSRHQNLDYNLHRNLFYNTRDFPPSTKLRQMIYRHLKTLQAQKGRGRVGNMHTALTTASSATDPQWPPQSRVSCCKKAPFPRSPNTYLEPQIHAASSKHLLATRCGCSSSSSTSSMINDAWTDLNASEYQK